MMRKVNPSRLVLMIGTLAFILGSLATNTAAAGPGTVTMTVTAVGKKETSPPIVAKEDVQFFLNKERTQIADWKHGGKLYLAVLIDDSLNSGIASQWDDLKVFLTGQPDTTYISVAYARNGTAMLAQDFTNDHELAAKALRLPIGGTGAFASPYLALQDLMKRWPISSDRRSILLFLPELIIFAEDLSQEARISIQPSVAHKSRMSIFGPSMLQTRDTGDAVSS